MVRKVYIRFLLKNKYDLKIGSNRKMELIIKNNGELDYNKPLTIEDITTETQLVDEGAELVGKCVRGKIVVGDFKNKMLNLRNNRNFININA